MTDSCLYELVALATGESVFEISRRGFHHATPARVAFDPEPGPQPLRPRRPSAEATQPPAAESGEAEVVDFCEHGIDWDEVLSGSRRDLRTRARRSARQLAQPMRGVR